MNKEQALNKLAALEAETKALRAIIEAPDKPAPPTRWKPEGDEDFLSISSLGKLRRFCNSPDRVEFGNCFQTVDHAEIASKAVSVTLKICAAAFTVDPDAGVQLYAVRSWSVAKRDFTISGKGQWVAGQYDATTSHPCYVHTFEQAIQMAAILNAEGV